MPSNERRKVQATSSCNLAAEDCERRIQEALEAAIEHLRRLSTGGWHPHVTAQLLEDALETFNTPLWAAQGGASFREVNPQIIRSAEKIGRAFDHAIRDLEEFNGDGRVVAALIDAREQHRALVHDSRLSQAIIDTLDSSITEMVMRESDGEQCTVSAMFLLALRDLMLAHYDDTGSEADADRLERAWKRFSGMLNEGDVSRAAEIMPAYPQSPFQRTGADGYRLAERGIDGSDLSEGVSLDTEPLLTHALDCVVADLTRIQGADMVPQDIIEGRAFIRAAGTSQGEA